MGIPNQVTKVVMHGNRGGGEIWESGYWLESSPTSLSDANALAQSIFAIHTAATNSLWAFLKPKLWDRCTLDYVRVYSYPAGGPTAAYTGQSTGTPVAGNYGTGNLGMVNQTAVCATFLTGAAGRSHRGRSYLPWDLALNYSQINQLTSADCTSLANAYRADFVAITATVNPYVPVVVSQKLTEKRRITSVRVDSRVDIQRRRAGSQRPLYAVSSVVIP